mmetsp:Transcript_9204/g.23003  ORF Transcript_9204/g.23003 Transcript_9204/m.23003 type:complete len:332 (-) Transcript_9204:21-1016(-)
MAIDLTALSTTLEKGKKVHLGSSPNTNTSKPARILTAPLSSPQVEGQWMTSTATECRTRDGLYYLYLRNGDIASTVSLMATAYEGSEESCWLMQNAWVMITSTTAFFLLCCLCCCISLRRIRSEQRELRANGPGGLGRREPFPGLARGEARDAGETEMVAFGEIGTRDDDNDGSARGATTAATADATAARGGSVGSGVFGILRRPSGEEAAAGGVGFRSLNLNRGLSRAMSNSVPPGAPGSVAVPAVAIAVPASMAHIPTAAAVAVPSGGVAEAVIQGPANTAGQSEGDLEEGEFDPVAPGEGGPTLAGDTAQSTLAVSSPRAAVASRVGL